MIIHRDFKSDCKRIAKEIEKVGDDGVAIVVVSEPLVEFMSNIYALDKDNFFDKFNAEINKHLKYFIADFRCYSFDKGHNAYVFDLYAE